MDESLFHYSCMGCVCIWHHLIIIMKPAAHTAGFVSVRRAVVELAKVCRKGLGKCTLTGSNESNGTLKMSKGWVERQKDEETMEWEEGKQEQQPTQQQITPDYAASHNVWACSHRLRRRFVDMLIIYSVGPRDESFRGNSDRFEFSVGRKDR